MVSSTARRVVITGMGLISPLGNTKEALWDALISGRSGVGPFNSVPTQHLTTRVAAEATAFTGGIDDFGPLPKEVGKAIRKAIKMMCRETQMGVAAAQLAQTDAGVVPSDLSPERSGVVFGSDYMLTLPEEFTDAVLQCGGREGAFDFTRWGAEGLSKMTPLWLLKYLPNMPASHIAIYNDLRGPNNSLTHREAAANLAVGEAYHTILRNHAERMLTGATGSRVHPMKAVHAMQNEQVAPGDADPAKTSRPFDADRTGMVLGEGSGVVILEEIETARARGATIFAEIIGTASSAVAGRDLVARRDAALVSAMRNAMRAAGVSPDEIGHVHAHGLSTTSSDCDEAKAIREVFGSHADKLPVVAAKSHLGNLGAGSGLIELIASTLALHHKALFPVLNYETPDPDCPIKPVVEAGINPGKSFLNLSVTPQGQASVLVVKSYDGN